MIAALRAVEQLRPRSLGALSGHLTALVRGRLWLKVLIGMFLGLATGVLIGPAMGLLDPSRGQLIGEWLALPGHLFLAVIQMIVVPLVFASIIRGLAAGENVEQLKRTGLGVAAFFLATTAVAASIGIAVTYWLKPGRALGSALLAEAPAGEPPPAGEAALDMGALPGQLIDVLPGNPLGSMVEGEMLQVVIFAAIVGVALVSMSARQSAPLLDLLGSLQEVCMTIVRWAMRLAPLAVFGLMARLMSQIGVGALVGMAFYVGTVLLGLLLLLLLYLLLIRVFSRMGPLTFLASIRELMLLAFSTSSSAAVMPLSIRKAEESLGVRASISQFVIPLGATINMNGTALYQGAAAVFLAQVYGIDVSLAGMALVVATAVGASVGSPATPGVGIVILSMVVSSIGVPVAGVALIMGVDRILDMSRTAVNVAGDLVACKLMDEWIGGELTAEEQRAEEIHLERERARTGSDTIAMTDQIPSVAD